MVSNLRGDQGRMPHEMPHFSEILRVRMSNGRGTMSPEEDSRPSEQRTGWHALCCLHVRRPNMKDTMRVKKIVMAVDPLDRDLKLNPQAIREVRYWVKHLNASVEAVYVLSCPTDLKLVRTKAVAEASLVESVRELKLHVPVKTTVLIDESMSKRHEVGTLLSYVKKAKADLVLLSSHGRTGLGRLVFGSFAESVLAESPVPVLFIGNKASSKDVPGRVLFPTDFSKASQKAFDDFVKRFGPVFSEVILYHVILRPFSYYDYGLVGFEAYVPQSYWKAQQGIALNLGKTWIERAKSAGIKARFLMDDEKMDTGQAILKTAQREATGLVVLACGRIGDTASELFRSPKHASWVYGPEVSYKSPSMEISSHRPRKPISNSNVAGKSLR